MSALKGDLLLLKSKLENIETELEGQMKDLEIREEKWKKMDEAVNEIIKNKNEIIQLNIGGKVFATKIETLLSLKDTLFYKMILSKKIDLKEEIFFDRSPKMFPYILDFIRYKKINYKRFSSHELNALRIEADYYEITEIYEYLEAMCQEIEFINFEVSGIYSYNGQTAGTQRVEDLKDRSMTKGICATNTITIELNNELEFDEIEIAGWSGD